VNCERGEEEKESLRTGGHGAGGTRTEWIEHPPTCS